MLEDTLVIWSGEFRHTAYSQGKLTKDNYGYNFLSPDGQPINPFKEKFTPGAVHVHDFHATILNQLGINRTQLTTTAQGRRFRLTDVHGQVVKELLA